MSSMEDMESTEMEIGTYDYRIWLIKSVVLIKLHWMSDPQFLQLKTKQNKNLYYPYLDSSQN